VNNLNSQQPKGNVEIVVGTLFPNNSIKTQPASIEKERTGGRPERIYLVFVLKLKTNAASTNAYPTEIEQCYTH
jgi:hypothetical protein